MHSRRVSDLVLVKYLYVAILILIAAAIATLPGCALLGGTVIHPIETETRSGQALVEEQIPDTGKRADLPANTPKDEIVAIVNVPGGGKVTIKENEHRTLAQKITGQQKYNYTLDEKAQVVAAEVKKETGHNLVEAPAPPWWKWPLIVGLVLIGAAILYYIRPVLAVLATIFSWLRKK